MYICLHVNCQILIKLQYSREAVCTIQIPNCMTVRLVGTEMFHAERETDGRTEGQADRQADTNDETNSRFSQFCERA